jgi:hypothetical protein
MRFVTTLSLDYFVGGDPATLVVVVSTDDAAADRLLAYGVDPARDEILFERVLSPADLGTFLKYVIDGSPASFVALASGGPVANSVEVPTTKPPPIGPSSVVVISYASATVGSTAIPNAA